MTDASRITCLAENGRRLWAETCESRQLSEPQMELLLLACKQFDRAAEARTILSSSQIVGVDRFGQEKQHPAVQIERMASIACANILCQIIGKTPECEPVKDDNEDFFGV